MVCSVIVLFCFRSRSRAAYRLILFLAVNLCVLAIADRLFGALTGRAPYRNSTYYARVIRLKQRLPSIDSMVYPERQYCDGTHHISQSVRLRTDDQGFIMPSNVHSNPDLRIFFIGGSTTECAWVDESNRFAFVVGRRLETRTSLQVNSYNAGTAGNNTLHSLNILLNEILPLHPDVAVLMENINDLNVLLFTGTYWNNWWSRSPIEEISVESEETGSLRSLGACSFQLLAPHLLSIWKNNLNLRSAMPDEWAGIRGHQLTYDREKIKDDFAKNLRLFVSICRIRGIHPVLMTQANRFTMIPDEVVAKAMNKFRIDFGITYADYFAMYTQMNEVIRNVAKDQDVTLIDLDKLIPKSSDYIYDTVHFNNAGSLLAANLITEYLSKLPQLSAPPAGNFDPVHPEHNN
jgi:hypothetical protein